MSQHSSMHTVNTNNQWSLFDWSDPFHIDKELTEEEKIAQDSAARFAKTHLQSSVVQSFRKESFDASLYPKMGSAGFFGAVLKGYGCAELSYTAYGLIAKELERVDSGYRSLMSVQSSLVMYPIYYFGSEEQRLQYLPDLALGNLVGCFGLTEPNHGSDPSQMETRAVKTTNGYRLHGQKTWITSAPLADVFIIWAKLESGNIGGFILEKDFSGLQTEKIQGKLSLRTSVTGTIFLDDVFVSEKLRLPHTQGLKSAMACLSAARLGIAWGVLGAAEQCWHVARQYAIDRKQFGEPLASKQLVQIKLADMQTNIQLGLLASLQATRLKDQQKLAPQTVSLIKRNNCRVALDTARLARDILGANGISEEFPIMRHLLNLETVNTYEGTEDIHGLILGRAQTGLSAF